MTQLAVRRPWCGWRPDTAGACRTGGQPRLLPTAMSIRAELSQHFACPVAEPVPASAALPGPGQAVGAGRSVGFSPSGGCCECRFVCQVSAASVKPAWLLSGNDWQE